MPTLSSHVLDTIAGVSAIGIRVQLFYLPKERARELLFDIESDDEGRIMQQIAMPDGLSAAEFELVFHSQAYFEKQGRMDGIAQNMRVVVVRFDMQDREARYHMPLVLSPHSYTLWWSK